MNDARVLAIDPDTVEPADLAPAAAWLNAGGIVAFPTDTLYGLAVDPTNDAAVRALFDLKGRSPRVALPLIAASVRQVEAACGTLEESARRLAAAWWPGPLSIVLDAPSSLSVAVHGGGRSVAVRVPAHRGARALAEACGALLTATSANISGAPAAVTAAGLGAIAADPRVFVIDGGPTTGGAPSTIVDARVRPPVLVRDGAIAWARVLESLRG